MFELNVFCFFWTNIKQGFDQSVTTNRFRPLLALVIMCNVHKLIVYIMYITSCIWRVLFNKTMLLIPYLNHLLLPQGYCAY